MSEKNINSALVRRVNKLLESRVEHDKVQTMINEPIMWKFYSANVHELSTFLSAE